MKVLYVEDNAVNRLLLEKSLKGLCDIQTEEDGFKALEIAELEVFDIFILDLNLGDPSIDGFKVLEELKFKRKKDATYAALTAYTGKEWEEKCMLAGFDLYFNKPVNPKNMWETISGFHNSNKELQNRPLYNSGLAQFLKEETAGLHKNVEESLNSSLLVSSELSKSAYLRHLATLAAGHFKISKALKPFLAEPHLKPFWPSEDFSQLLINDLAQLEPDKPLSAVEPVALHFNDWQEALGALYVVNGSSLGRKFIAAKIKSKLTQWSIEAYFYGPVAGSGINWSSFKKDLNSLTKEQLDFKKVLRGSELAFKSFI